MKKENVLYYGDLNESVWSALGYIGPMFIVTMNLNKKSMFMQVNGLRSAIIFFLFLIVNFPVLLIKYRILYLPSFISMILFFIGFIISVLLFIDYIYSTYQASNGFYKKTFFVDHIFNKIINNYMINKFLPNK